jgi:hypothetical protein
MFFYYPVHLLILYGLVLLLVRTEKPFLCSGIYTGVHIFFSILLGANLLSILVLGAIAFLLASLYFWLLSRIQTGHPLWWIVLVGGIILGAV